MSDDLLGFVGLRDPDQVTKEATDEYRAAMLAEFSPMERYRIRLMLELGPPNPSLGPLA